MDNSLPLMGIGNNFLAVEELTNWPLITPHGDWEPRYIPPADTGVDVSLPLMGIGNRPGVCAGPLWGVCSLPLMGIGNQRRVRARARQRHLITPHGDWEPAASAGTRTPTPPHYPSWGLGTSPSSRRGTGPPRTHYPSWGLGTEVVGHHGERVHELITPHGDWEPFHNVVEAKVLRGSLPLMGIGNPDLLGVAPPPLDELITPHGDWEPGKPDKRRGRDHLSLPLMGIGNPLEDAPGRMSRAVLITPHGDWEPPSQRSMIVPAACSLPLMGIGNPGPGRSSCLPSAPHYPSWGLGTRTRRRRPRSPGRLITPHGDWEPPARIARCRSCSVHSLPLMGIGNRGREGAYGRRAEELITPHGDWEPLRAAPV